MELFGQLVFSKEADSLEHLGIKRAYEGLNH